MSFSLFDYIKEIIEDILEGLEELKKDKCFTEESSKEKIEDIEKKVKELKRELEEEE